jgi:hypothetical protein
MIVAIALPGASYHQVLSDPCRYTAACVASVRYDLSWAGFTADYPISVKAEPPRETFETIIIDPPWPMTKIERDIRPCAHAPH